MTKDMRQRLENFILRGNLYRSGHYDACRHYAKLDKLISIPTVIFGAAILGCASYGIGTSNTPEWVQYSIAFLSIVQGALVAIQTYLRPGEIAERHRQSAFQLGNIMRDYEYLLLRMDKGENVLPSEIKKVMEKSKNVSRESKALPKHIILTIREKLEFNI